MTSEAVAILSAVDEYIARARTALETQATPIAVTEGQRLLQHVEELLARGVGDPVADIETRRAMVGLRDELGSYLLASSTLTEVGAAPGVVVDILQRGAETVDAMLDELTSSQSGRGNR
jgi:hypothetical protein